MNHWRKPTNTTNPYGLTVIAALLALAVQCALGQDTELGDAIKYQADLYELQEKMELKRYKNTLLDEMVYIESGTYVLGVDDNDINVYLNAFGAGGPKGVEAVNRQKTEGNIEKKRSVEIDGFYISKHEVANGLYYSYTSQSGATPPEYLIGGHSPERLLIHAWRDGRYPEGRSDFPVMGVFYSDCLAFCKWLSSNTGILHRPPTGEEWEAAYRGREGRLFPWGNTWLIQSAPDSLEFQWHAANVCQSRYVGPERVQDEIRDATPDGIVNMFGNIREWTQPKYDPFLKEVLPIARGLSYEDFPVDLVVCSYVSARAEEYSSWDVGIRLVVPSKDGKPLPYDAAHPFDFNALGGRGEGQSRKEPRISCVQDRASCEPRA